MVLSVLMFRFRAHVVLGWLGGPRVANVVCNLCGFIGSWRMLLYLQYDSYVCSAVADYGRLCTCPLPAGFEEVRRGFAPSLYRVRLASRAAGFVSDQVMKRKNESWVLIDWGKHVTTSVGDIFPIFQ